MLNKKFKLLVIANKERFIHLEKFLEELNKKGVETKLIYDLDYVNKFLELNFMKKSSRKKEFEKILKTFNPNVILLDRISRIAENIVDKKIPLWILMRGNYWEEAMWAKKTIYKSKKQKISVERNEKLADYCFKNSKLILPISKYLEKEVRKRYPGKDTVVFPADGRDPYEWENSINKKLKHPCVGLIQGLNIWGKTRELLILDKVMKELPEITFYLAGDGIYAEKIISELTNNKNFVWLKNLDYPYEVKKFLSEIDIFLLLSGLEGLGQIIIESLLMKKPTIASNIGGIPELIIDNETGLLVENGNNKMIVNKISKFLDEPEFARKITNNGYELMKKEFSWIAIANKFEVIIEKFGRYEK
jgi:glycosyltransferase involved in cell wall biosynthesis